MIDHLRNGLRRYLLHFGNIGGQQFAVVIQHAQSRSLRLGKLSIITGLPSQDLYHPVKHRPKITGDLQILGRRAVLPKLGPHGAFSIYKLFFHNTKVNLLSYLTKLVKLLNN